MTALPDPDYQAEFYTGVPAKRLFAWVVDSLLITIAAILLVPFTGFVGLFVWPAFYLAVGACLPRGHDRKWIRDTGHDNGRY